MRFLILLVIAIPLGWYAYYDSKKGPPDDTPKKDKVFSVEADKIDEIEVKSESGDRTTLRKKGSDWEIVQPMTAASDQAAVSGITSNLASAEIQRVIEENPPDLKEYGLDSPRVEVAFKMNGQQRRLLLGQKTPAGSDIYAKLPDSKRVFLVPSFLDSTFNRSTFDLRDKSVLKVDRDKVDSLEVATKDRTMRFEKKNGEWQIAQPPAGRAEFGAVDGLVSRVSSVQMKSIVPDATDLKKSGLDKPVATVRLGSGSSQASLAIGSAAESGSVYAKDLSRPTVFTIESSLADDLKKDPSEYRQKDLFDARSFNTSRLEIVHDNQTTVFEKTKIKNKDGKEEEKWKQTAPAAKDVDASKVEALITAATGARATGFVDSTAKTGLDKPELTVAFKYDEGKEERVTFARTKDGAYGARAGAPGAAKVDAAVIDSIVKALGDVK
ncbi:MAG: DUF4340 domain-containing protein [Vicinamibacterales bacterium]